MIRGTGRSLLLLGAVPAVLAACASGRRSTTAEENFTFPVDSAFIAGGDSMYVLHVGAVKLLSDERQLLLDLRDDARQAGWLYGRYLGTQPPAVTAVLSRPDPNAKPSDRTPLTPTPPPPAAACAALPPATDTLHVAVPRVDRDEEAPMPVMAMPNQRTNATTQQGQAARAYAMIASLEHSPLGSALARDWVARLNGLPTWYQCGLVPMLTAFNGEQQQLLLSIAVSNVDRAPSLDSLGTAGHVSADTGRVPRALTELAMDYSLLSFLVQRGGAGSVGQLATALRSGKSLNDALASVPTLPHSVADLDKAWRDWLHIQKPKMPANRRRSGRP